MDRAPTVYLKEVRRVRDDHVRLWHRRLWNHGIAPILVVADRTNVHIYSGWAVPAAEQEDPKADHRLVRTLDRAAHALELEQLIHSVETGHFYTQYARCFDREKAVDSQLLQYLEAARRELTTGEDALPGSDADALLTRTIFVCYLIAREIICGEHFPGTKLSTIEKDGGLQKLIDHVSESEAGDLLFDLFGQLKDTFNGSLFDTDLEQERARIKPQHMRVLQRFLRGDDPQGGQRALGFPAYDFSLIPIETISAIYEKFIEAGDEGKRRQRGAYYTPPHLVELVVDHAVEGWASLLDKRALDIASGSGIFLVSLFNRMAEEWRRQNPNKRNSTRARELADILQQRLCGVDVSETACRIASFSLSLALLDQLEPRDIQELCKDGWRLPLLLRLREPASSACAATVLEGNLFDPDLPLQDGSFHLVVGNPPWVSRGASKDAAFLNWCSRHPEKPVPEQQTAHGFMWRAPDFLKPGGRACLLLPSAVLLNKTSSDFQRKWFQRFAVDKVTDLSDLRKVLFVGSNHPAVVMRFSKEEPALDDARIHYDAPKADPQSLRGGPVRVFEPDQWRFRQSEVLLRAGQNGAPLVWKERLWGTPRDLRSLERLRDFPPLGNLVSSPKRRQRKRWMKGQGFQPYNPEERDSRTGQQPQAINSWWSKDHLFLDASAEFRMVLLQEDAERIGDRFRNLRRSPDTRVFRPPMVIFNKGFTKRAFCGFPVLFRHAVQSIVGPRQDEDLLRFLAAVLNCDLASYFLFHTAASWGTERDEVHLFEILRMPFPLPEQTEHPRRAEEIVAAVADRLKRLEEDASQASIGRQQLTQRAKSELEPLILEYYDIDDWESKLIQDTLQIHEKSSTPAGPSSRVPALHPVSGNQRRDYARSLCAVLNEWANGSGYTVNPSVIYSQNSGLGVVTLTKDRSQRDYTETQGSAELNQALARMAKLLPQRQAGVEMVRGMKVFDDHRLHIVKPLMLRFWTETAALNDADEIAWAILRKG
ncbi:MAG: class I SAM-dependent DNA methyltransferase [Candidatus Brocadiia bacterium]